jgi:hypothetical protein
LRGSDSYVCVVAKAFAPTKLIEALPRPLVALTVIVAFVAIYVGIKDYVGQKKATSPATTSTPTAVHSNAIAKTRKTAPARTRRARMAATAANPPARPRAAADTLEQQLIRDEFADTGAKSTVSMYDGPNGIRSQAAQNEGAAMDRNGRVHNGLDAIVVPGLKACLPLPNMTEPGDVDAPYYENWAREYCGI